MAVATATIPGTTVAERINASFPGAVVEATDHAATVAAERIVEVARFLRDDEELDCKYLNCITGIDWLDYFDVVYVLSSLARNHMLFLAARTGHDDPVVPSVVGVWQGANLQEREIYDLMGIAFPGHPNMKRIFLWEGFPGHPLRKDFLTLPGGYRPGLQRFPFEFPAGQREYPSLGAEPGPQAPGVPRLRQPLPGSAEAQELSGGQLGVRGGGSSETRFGRFDSAGPRTPENAEAGAPVDEPSSTEAPEATNEPTSEPVDHAEAPEERQ